MTAETDIAAIEDGGLNPASEVRAALTSVLGRADAFVGASVTGTSNQAIASGTPTKILWDAETYDTDSFHDNATNPDRLTVPFDGKYLVTGSIHYTELDAGGDLQGSIYKNGVLARWLVRENNGPSGDYVATVSQVLDLSAGDFLNFEVSQLGGAFSIIRQSSYIQITKTG